MLLLRPSAWAAIPVGTLLLWTLPAVPWGVVAYGPQLPTRTRESELLFLGEGMNSSIAVSRHDATRYFHVSGKIEASSEAQDMRLQRMLGHIPALIHPKPQSVLVVGCGAGVTAGTFVVYPEVQRIVICEIERMVPQVVARYFSRENYDVVNDRRTEIVNDDARHYVFTAREQFDVITSDPIHPWVKGSATLYTKEYFELCKRRLKPGGIITQWVPLYESTHDVVKSEIATFLEVFPDGVVWGNDTIFDEGYDVVLMGRNGGGPIDIDAMQSRLDGNKRIMNSLRNVGFLNAAGLMSTYAGRGPDLRPWLKDAHINLDRNLRLQYLAGMRFHNQQAPEIYMDILSCRKLPAPIFK
jgi:spermidine synthase